MAAAAAAQRRCLMSLYTDSGIELGGGGWGAAKGGASLTQNCSLFELHHIHLLELLSLWVRAGRGWEQEKGKWGTKTESRRLKKGNCVGELRDRRERERERDVFSEGGRETIQGSRALWQRPFITASFLSVRPGAVAERNIQRGTRDTNTSSLWRNTAAMLEKRPQIAAFKICFKPG